MARLLKLVIVAVVGGTLIASCNQNTEDTPQAQSHLSPSVTAKPSLFPRAGWVFGPDRKTPLLLSEPTPNHYEVTLRSLHGVATYPGV